MHDPSTHDCHSATPEAVKKLSMMMAFTMALFGMDSRSQHEILASVNKPRYFTWYDIDADNQTKYGANLVWDRNLTTLDKAFADYKVQGMWSITGRCDVGVNKVYGEPYCGGATGLVDPSCTNTSTCWKVGAKWAVNQIVGRPHIIGMYLGDEPEIMGVPGEQMCSLALELKTLLIAAKRSDVFIYYNDAVQGTYAPSFVKNKKLCKGLDYVSIDSYNDDPATEVANAASAYAGMQLDAPNPYASKGQGFFVIPGIFWFDNPPVGQPIPSPSWLVGKMKLSWEYCAKTAGCVGLNPWHWGDRNGMKPPSFARGANSMLGGNATDPAPDGSLAQWYLWIGGNISSA
jgi:hypothetical protein